MVHVGVIAGNYAVFDNDKFMFALDKKSNAELIVDIINKDREKDLYTKADFNRFNRKR